MNVSHYPVRSGLFAGEYPGHSIPDVTVSRLRELVSKGVTTFVDLTAPADALIPYEPLFSKIGEAGGKLTRHSFAIPDLDVPSDPGLMRTVMELIRVEIGAGRTCYVHCRGGIGRTGTVVGCWLREEGWEGEAALAEVQRLYSRHMAAEKQLRYPRSPQQLGQVRYILDWPAPATR